MTPNSFLPRERRHNPTRDQAQLRRRYFFKLLERCGVSIEQRKGSEIKLLRAGGHTFRIGNHYGNNPTIPFFLVINIIRRLGITRDEWLDSLAAGVKNEETISS
jgi:hypothetical protein